jgi:hypothetical protein
MATRISHCRGCRPRRPPQTRRTATEDQTSNPLLDTQAERPCGGPSQWRSSSSRRACPAGTSVVGALTASSPARASTRSVSVRKRSSPKTSRTLAESISLRSSCSTLTGSSTSRTRAFNFPVANRAILLLTEVVAHHAANLVSVGKKFVQRAVLGNPLDGGFLANLVDTDQVVAGFSHQCGDIGIALGRNSVALLHCFWCVALQLRRRESSDRAP